MNSFSCSLKEVSDLLEKKLPISEDFMTIMKSSEKMLEKTLVKSTMK